jgi:hypothetical protein
MSTVLVPLAHDTFADSHRADSLVSGLEEMTRIRIGYSAAVLLIVLAVVGYRGTFHFVPTLLNSVSASAAYLGQPEKATDEEIWKRIQQQKTSKNVKYVHGVSLSPIPKELSAADVAVGQALFYLEARYGAIASRHQFYGASDRNFSAEVEYAQIKLQEKGFTFAADTIATELVALRDDNENRYSKFLSGIPVESSETGYIARLFRQHTPPRERLDAINVLSSLDQLASSYRFKYEAKPVDVTFETLAKGIDDGYIPVLIGTSLETWATGAGYFIDGSRKYLIVHEPKSADPSGDREDIVPNISTPVKPGVKLYRSDSLPYSAAVLIGNPKLSIPAFADFIKSHSKTNVR